MLGLLAGLAAGVAEAGVGVAKAAVGTTQAAVTTTAVVAHETSKAANEVVERGGLGNTIIGASTRTLVGLTEMGVNGADKFSQFSGDSLNVDYSKLAALGSALSWNTSSASNVVAPESLSKPVAEFVKVTQFDFDPNEQFAHGITFNGGGGVGGATVGPK